MGCPRCGKGWFKVQRNRLICECGYMVTVKMPDDAELIEKYERELQDILSKMLKAGVRYEVVYRLLTDLIKDYELQSYAKN